MKLPTRRARWTPASATSMARSRGSSIRRVRSTAPRAKSRLSNANLSNRTGAQASSIEHTSASMRALWATISRTADTAQAANRLAASASSIAQKGGGVVGQLVQTLAAVRA
ncbi:hypothetical protein LP420_37575 [Massilia sp. B-10]|nr:hypothetical protein LP420_37575 [Massilia sp. B-10]